MVKTNQKLVETEIEKIGGELRGLESQGKAIIEQCKALDTARDDLAASHNQHLLSGDAAAMSSTVDEIALNRQQRREQEAELQSLQSSAIEANGRLTAIIETLNGSQRKLEGEISRLTVQLEAASQLSFMASLSFRTIENIRALKVDLKKPEPPKQEPVVMGGPSQPVSESDTQPKGDIVGGYQQPKQHHVVYGLQGMPVDVGPVSMDTQPKDGVVKQGSDLL